jgi:Mg-chelatase subunit ChlD
MKHTFVHGLVVPLCGALIASATQTHAIEGGRVIEQARDHRVWELTKEIPTGLGRAHVEKTHIVELAGGMNRWDAAAKVWTPASDTVELFQDGAIARNLSFSVIFAPSLADAGSLDILLPDGEQRLRGHPIGIVYSEGGQSVLVAEVQPCAAEVVGGNNIVYRNACSDYLIDIEYQVRKDSVSQWLFVHERLPHPSTFNMSEAAHVEVLTEWVLLPQHNKRATVIERATPNQRALVHEQISLGGGMDFATSKAFALNAPESTTQTVFTTLENFADGRICLVESVPYHRVAAELAKLPEPQAAIRKRRDAVVKASVLPLRGQASTKLRPIQMARAAPARSPAFIWDWTTVLTTNLYRWTNGGTFYISGPVTVNTNIFEPCVIKFAPTNGAKLTIIGPVTCLTTNFSPLVLTHRDDHSVGEAIGANPLSGYAAATALFLDNLTSGQIYELNNLRISHADTAIRFNYGSGHKLRNVQIVNCNYAVSGYESAFSVLNGLFSRINTSAVVAGSMAGTTGTLQNVTVRECKTLIATYACANVTNSLLIAVTNTGVNLGGTFYGAYNGTNSSPSAALQTVGGGAHYLLASGPYRDAGTTNIDATLLAELRRKTTQPPIVFSNVAISLPTTFTPQAERDKNAIDLGFHYDPLDVVFGGVDANTNLTFAPGTVAGWFRKSSGFTHAGHGIHMADRQIVTFDGRADAPAYWVRCNTVQEGATGLWDGGYGTGGITGWASTIANSPEIRARFTRFSMLAGDGNHLRDDNGYLILRARDCEFWRGGAGGYLLSIYATNCLMDAVGVVQAYGATGNEFHFRNCTFKGGYWIMSRASATMPASVYDCAFDGINIVNDAWGNTDYNYNAYMTGATNLWPTGSTNLFASTFGWQTGDLGRFYLPTNSTLLNSGSTNAAARALYHFTCTTNNVKEATSVVDMGYHYVATSGGLPLDTDVDGIADYLEDHNGDGITDGLEDSFANPVLIIASPLNYTKGSTAKRLDPNAIVYDIDTPNFGGGQLTVTTVVSANPDDRLNIRDEGTGAGQIGVNTNTSTVTYGGVSIGTFSGGIGVNPLVITFNTSASNPAVQALVRNLTFHNVSSSPTTSSRLLNFALTDGTGGANSATFQTVNVICPQAIDAMLVIDISNSLSPTNFVKAKQAASNFVSQLSSNDLVGLVSFAGYAYLNSALTNDGPAVQDMITSLTNASGTTFHYALDLARTNLMGTASNVLPLVILLSDGRLGTTNASGDPGETEVNRALALQAAAAVQDAGIRMISIAYGTNSGVNNGTNLMRVFASTPSDYYYSPTASQIESNYNAVAQGLCRGTNLPPAISILNPANNAELAGPATFEIRTDAKDLDGEVKQVQFFNGTNSLGIVTNLPFHLTWSNVAGGSYTLKAVATDSDNLSAESQVEVKVSVCSQLVTNTLALNPTSVVGGLTSIGTVTLTSAADKGGQAVTLWANRPEVFVPGSVLVPEGSNTCSFVIHTKAAENDVTAAVSAMTSGGISQANLTVLSTGFKSTDSSGQCGPMDVAVVFDISDSMKPEFQTVSNALTAILDSVEFASGGDYRLALVSFNRDVYVNEQFAMTNRVAFSNAFSLLQLTGSEEASDEALNTVINNLSPSESRTNQIGNFTTAFRLNAQKVIILITDEPPYGFGEFYGQFDVGIDDVNAHQRAVEAYMKDIRICALISSDGIGYNPLAVAVARDYAQTTGGTLVFCNEYDLSTNTETQDIHLKFEQVISQCGGGAGKNGVCPR